MIYLGNEVGLSQRFRIEREEGMKEMGRWRKE
jgi:hypothetical protein